MVRQVWKYDLRPEIINVLSLPRGAKVLCTQLQKGVVAIWFEIPNIDLQVAEKRVFHVVGTAQNLPEKATKYVGTVQVENGYTAWHVYEEDAAGRSAASSSNPGRDAGVRKA